MHCARRNPSLAACSLLRAYANEQSQMLRLHRKGRRFCMQHRRRLTIAAQIWLCWQQCDSQLSTKMQLQTRRAQRQSPVRCKCEVQSNNRAHTMDCCLCRCARWTTATWWRGRATCSTPLARPAMASSVRSSQAACCHALAALHGVPNANRLESGSYGLLARTSFWILAGKPAFLAVGVAACVAGPSVGPILPEVAPPMPELASVC